MSERGEGVVFLENIGADKLTAKIANTYLVDGMSCKENSGF